ncbi:MAG: cytochrome c [Saprospiraceae bacterium]|nr:cytochrome c [Saprospiraceae bacterium]
MKVHKFLSIRLIAIMSILIWSALSISAQVSADAGKELFKANCAACHAKDMRSAATGPALGGSQALWGDDAALYAWIRNSQAMIKKGHPRAVELWNKYKPVVMTNFEKLTDDEIGSILAYVNGTYDGTYGPVKSTASSAKKEAPKVYYHYILLLLQCWLSLHFYSQKLFQISIK